MDMAGSWHQALAAQAQLLLGRLEEGVWAGLGLLRSGLGIDLGLEPWLKRQPPGSAGLALLLLLLLLPPTLWALGRRLLFPRKRLGSPTQPAGPGGRRSGSGGGRNREKTPTEAQRLEEQRRRNKRKEKPKKSQPNGRAGSEPLEEEILHPFEKLIVKQLLDTEKKTEKTKKNKKKPKAEMKQLQDEPQNWAEGAWETKISSREKRQQRRRDKGINETSAVDSSVGSEAVPVPQHTAASPGLAPRKTKGAETAVAPGWGEQLTVNGGGWCDVPVKAPTQINATKDEKWRQIPVLANAKRNPDQPAWGQEGSDTNAEAKEWAVPLADKTWSEHALFPSIGAWAGVNDRINTSEQKPPFSTVGAKTAVASTASEPASQPSTADPQRDANPAPSPVDDAWSGINGISTADPSSDWNAPTEEWGNWLVEEPASAAQPEDVVAETHKLSDEEKEKVDSALQGSTNNKSKKKKKKKKKVDDAIAPVQEAEEQEKEAISGGQEQLVVPDQPERETAPPVETICTSEPAEVEEAPPVEITEEPAVIVENSSQDITSQVPDTLSETESSVSATKPNNLPPSQAKPEESWESPKQVKKKKKARRET
ncbi:protein LYRIC-like isoform X2 [Scyliorhinus canicula]|uniref:protein LYRIC-like isoform X2 n=1 Tax=Scyliorhinus canicula TaxID=7830 RepID=UPI0018F3878B|nr:protein LYRIC-like isoform X2 [Scyliorhinus canicula]